MESRATKEATALQRTRDSAPRLLLMRVAGAPTPQVMLEVAAAANDCTLPGLSLATYCFCVNVAPLHHCCTSWMHVVRAGGWVGDCWRGRVVAETAKGQSEPDLSLV
jgi:hypothetical protein